MKLKFNQEGLIPAIIQDEQGQDNLCLYEQRIIRKTLSTGVTWFYSRSRKNYGRSETSGNVQQVLKITADCDYDTLLIQVRQMGQGACRKGFASCFIICEEEFDSLEEKPVFHPEAVYNIRFYNRFIELLRIENRILKKVPIPTIYLKNIDKILKRWEKAAEVIIQ